MVPSAALLAVVPMPRFEFTACCPDDDRRVAVAVEGIGEDARVVLSTSSSVIRLLAPSSTPTAGANGNCCAHWALRYGPTLFQPRTSGTLLGPTGNVQRPWSA